MIAPKGEVGLTRREFLRIAGVAAGMVSLMPLIEGCARQAGLEIPSTTTVPTPRTTPIGETPTTVVSSPSPQPTSNDAANIAKVALIKTGNRTTGVRKAIDLLGINPVKGKKVILKPNFNTADPAPGSTHNDTLRSLVLKLREMGATKITLAERSGPPDTRTVMEQKGIFALAKELDFEVVNLQEVGPEAWTHIRPTQSHWRDGFLFAKVYHEAECIVQTCCLKTHAYGGHFTMSLKNSVGMVPRVGYGYMDELHRSPYQRLMIAEINAAYTPSLILLDGVEAFVSGGPDRGRKVKAEVILAGIDRIAIDAVGVAILRRLGTTPEVNRGPIFQQEQIARAVELGLGVDSPNKITLVTPDAESETLAKNIRRILAEG